MLVFRDAGVAFVHVPKTCGTALRGFLAGRFAGAEDWWGVWECPPASPESSRFDVVDRAHYTAEMVREFAPGLWGELAGMRVFSVLRDPYSRALSAYEQFRRQHGDHVGRAPSFADYLMRVWDRAWERERDGYLFVHGAPQVEFYFPGHVLLGGENLSEGLSGLFGVDLDFVSRERPLRELTSWESSLVEEVYREDIALWRSSVCGGLPVSWASPQRSGF